MAHCVDCYYSRKTTLGTFEPAWTCLHPLARSAIGYPMTCYSARELAAVCGPAAHLFKPQGDRSPPPSQHYFRQ